MALSRLKRTLDELRGNLTADSNHLYNEQFKLVPAIASLCIPLIKQRTKYNDTDTFSINASQDVLKTRIPRLSNNSSNRQTGNIVLNSLKTIYLHKSTLKKSCSEEKSTMKKTLKKRTRKFLVTNECLTT